MNWIDILKKNDKEFEKLEKIIQIVEEEKSCIYDPNILILEDEFENLYLHKIINIITEFKSYIHEDFLPFLNKPNLNKYNFYDYVKENCIEFYNLTDKVNNENELYLKELEETNEEEYYDDLELSK